MPHHISRITADEWREFRDLRLQALLDSPRSFSETHADVAAQGEAAWRARAAVAAVSQTSAVFAARDPASGAWIGTAAAGPLAEVEDTAHVHAVYVAPGRRGPGGPAEELMAAAIAWARDHTDAAHLTLGVHEGNARARAFYRRIGFTDTGKTVPYLLDRAERLVIMGYPRFRPAWM